MQTFVRMTEYYRKDQEVSGWPNCVRKINKMGMMVNSRASAGWRGPSLCQEDGHDVCRGDGRFLWLSGD